MQVTIPSFLSKRSALLGQKPTDEKKEFIQKYKNWKNNEITKEFVKWVEFQINDSIEKEEGKNDFLSLFQSKYHSAHAKGSRGTLRKILKQFK